MCGGGTPRNYRTQTEYDDALILKSFSFEAIAYYFLLTYCATPRHAPPRTILITLNTQYWLNFRVNLPQCYK